MGLPMAGELRIEWPKAILNDSKRFGNVYHHILGGLFAGTFLFLPFYHNMAISDPFNLKKSTPSMVNFLNQDQHDQWRFYHWVLVTDGYLSSQTKAAGRW
jgi:hypothetical protein